MSLSFPLGNLINQINASLFSIGNSSFLSEKYGEGCFFCLDRINFLYIEQFRFEENLFTGTSLIKAVVNNAFISNGSLSFNRAKDGKELITLGGSKNQETFFLIENLFFYKNYCPSSKLISISFLGFIDQNDAFLSGLVFQENIADCSLFSQGFSNIKLDSVIFSKNNKLP